VREPDLDGRIAYIRQQEAAYHEACYSKHALFEPGSWLHKPVKTVLEGLELLHDREGLRVLDLGSGVGRNAIPIARTISARGGVVVCVDLLQSALEHLVRYSEEHGVKHCIESRLADIDRFEIGESEYDYSIAVSTLEHVGSEERFKRKLGELARGTRPGGAVCLIIGSNHREVETESGRDLDPLFEVLLPTERLQALISHTYRGWIVKRFHVSPQAFDIERDGKAVKLYSDVVTFLAQKESVANG
jgi:cyclopropane fatty-acyl-phospholipid synthase-like methyltransferase